LISKVQKERCSFSGQVCTNIFKFARITSKRRGRGVAPLLALLLRRKLFEKLEIFDVDSLL